MSFEQKVRGKLNSQVWVIQVFSLIGAAWVLYSSCLGVYDRAKSMVIYVEQSLRARYERTIIVETAKASEKTGQDTGKNTQTGEPDAAVIHREGTAAKGNGEIDQIVKAVYRLESSSGKNGTDQGCHAKGLHNGYGYSPGSCYESDEATSEIVKKWFERELKDHSLAQSLCRYNIGKYLDDCEYYQDYLIVKE